MDFVAIDLETANEKRSSAAANILINIAKELNLDKIEDISKVVGFKLGHMGNNTYLPCKKVKEGVVSTKYKDYNDKDDLFLSNTNYFNNKIVVLTGELYLMSRTEATNLIEKLGGTVRNFVTKKNNILINNVKNSENLNTNQMSNKLKTALNYINQGQDLIIIDEEKLEEILKGKNTILNKY